MRYTIAKPEDRRELDSFVRDIYDRVSDAGDQMSRQTYASLVQGGAANLGDIGDLHARAEENRSNRQSLRSCDTARGTVTNA